ncbi:MAG: DNA recombination protein RmuC [Armatimonadetes bacterium]|nr:DNA recombination protein RmuC [Armatimonadota bacterium]MBX3108753.1 DNA recombination protein RmuC [Fimbriimonadaceae bacterium]
MDAIAIVVAAVCGVLVGAGLVWFLLRGKDGVLRSEAEALRLRVEGLLTDRTKAEAEASGRSDRILQLELELNQAVEEREALRQRYHECDVELNTLKATLDERELSFEKQINEIKSMESNLKESFKVLSSEALSKSTEELIKRYRDHDEEAGKAKKAEIENLLQPVQKELKRLEEFNQKMDQERKLDSSSLGEQIKQLASGTGKLISALQGAGSAGRWGEVQLKRIVELAGMQERVDYVAQESIAGTDGVQRPDMQVFLPGGRTMVIDSKVPIQDLEAMEAADEDGRKALSMAVANKVMEYAKSLNKKDYAKLESAPDYVVMFMASESAFRMAVEGRPGLIEDVMNLNVVVATPSTLLSLLKAVNYGWRQEKLAKEAQNIQKWGKDLYDALVTMKGYYDDLGRKINAVGVSYNKFGGSLDRHVIPKARRMADAGLPVKEEVNETAVVEFSERELRAADFAALPESGGQLSLD